MRQRPCRLAVIIVMAVLLAGPALAGDVWQATHRLEPGDRLQRADLAAQPPRRVTRDAIPATRAVLGLEVKRRIYPGHTLTERDVGPPTVVQANSGVEVLWKVGNLTLRMQGRALESGALGEDIRVLNTASARTIHGTVVAGGLVEVRSEP